MNNIQINGKTINVPDGCSIVVDGNNVYSNGKLVNCELASNMNIEIIVNGPVESVKTDRGNIKVNGDASRVEAGGSVTCGSVKGDVDAGGSVTCVSVGGDVDAGGSVNCGPVGGSIDAGGSVNHC